MKYTLLLSIFMAVSVQSQDLKTTVKEVLSSNPVILERLKNYNSIKQDVTSAQSGYYPKIDLVLGVGTERTDRENRANGLADQSFDFTVYQNSLTLTQNLFNGFQTTYRVAQQKNRAVSAAYSYIESVNDTSFETVQNYIEVMKNTELLANAKENVEINEEIFQKVKKLFDSGLTTLSEVNKIESSLALAKANYIVQENTYLDTTYALQRLVGRFLNPQKMLEPELSTTLPETLEDATQYAIKNNPSILVSRYNIKLAEASYKEKKSAFYPQIDLEVSQSMNKNLSATEGNEDKFRAMAFFKYNFFNGFDDTAAIQKSISQIHQENQSTNDLRRQVIEGLNLSWAANEKLSQQLVHLQNYQNFSEKTLTLYSKEYDLGRRSLLDLLSAQNDLIGSRSQIITTKYNMLFAKYRILDAMGILLENIFSDTTKIYSNVNLIGSSSAQEDTLPVHHDSDNDLIVDTQDICSNSLVSDTKNIYGCKSVLKGIFQVERYKGFLFEGSSLELTDESLTRLNNLIKQLENYGLKNIEFEVLGNIQATNLSSDELYEISAKRADLIKSHLVNAGADVNKITIHAQSNKAPMYSNTVSEGQELNNRVDIIVLKIKK